jgi:hypothetical protein
MLFQADSVQEWQGDLTKKGFSYSLWEFGERMTLRFVCVE